MDTAQPQAAAAPPLEAAAPPADAVAKVAENIVALPPADPTTPSPPTPPTTDDGGSTSALRELVAYAQEKIQGRQLTPELQQQLADLLEMAPRAQSELGDYSVQLIRLAVTGLLQEPAQQQLADEIQKRLQWQIRVRDNLALSLIAGDSQATRVVMGLTALLFLFTPLTLWLLKKVAVVPETVAGMSISDLMMVGVAGACGSAVSIMTRLRDLDKAEGAHSTMVMLGFFKPLIGLFLALFVYVVLRSGLLPLKVPTDGTAEYYYAALAFLAGFSERFANDVAAQISQKAVPGATSDTPVDATPGTGS